MGPLTCQFCDGYGTERCSHCDDGHQQCSCCGGTGGNYKAIDVGGFEEAAKGAPWVLYDGFTVIGRKTEDGKREVRYADFVFTGAVGGVRSLLEDLP